MITRIEITIEETEITQPFNGVQVIVIAKRYFDIDSHISMERTRAKIPATTYPMRLDPRVVRERGKMVLDVVSKLLKQGKRYDNTTSALS